MKRTTYILSGLSAFLFCTSSLYAQTEPDSGEKSKYRMEDLRQSLIWSGSYNAAGLRFMDFKNYSYAEAYLNKNNGGFVKYYQSDNSFDYGVRTESYTRIKKVTMYGLVEYNNFRGENMTNTAFICPERYLIGMGDSIPAQKRMEYYKLAGGIAMPVFKNLSAGLSIDYIASDMAKMKDLRAKSTMFDVKIAGSLLYSFCWLDVGGSYIYQKFCENLTIAQISPEDNIITGFYYTGLWFGIFDPWGSTKLTSDKFFTDVLKGGAAQLCFKTYNMRFFNEFAYRSQDGYWGKSIDVANTVNSGKIYEYTGKITVLAPSATHYLNVNTRFEKSENSLLNIFEEKIGGWTFPRLLGLSTMLQRNTMNSLVEYVFAYGNQFHPTLVLKAGYSNVVRNSSAAVVNPYLYTQEIHRNDIYIHAMKRFGIRNGMIDATLRIGGGNGYGDVLTQNRTDINPDIEVVQGFGQQREDLLHKEYEYYTARSIDGMAGIRYTRFLRTKNSGQSLYADARYDFRRAIDLHYFDSSYAGLFRIAIGYGF